MNPDNRNNSVSTRDTTIEQIDARSSRLLEAEIENLRREGIETSVAPSDDEAYDNQDKIAQVYHWLEGVDDRIDAARNAKSGRYAPFGVGVVAKKLARRGLKAQLDAIRADYLYNVVEAVPWVASGRQRPCTGNHRRRIPDDERRGRKRLRPDEWPHHQIDSDSSFR